MSIEESQKMFNILTSNCKLQTDNSYISDNGRIIWTSSDHYKTANSYNVERSSVKKKTTKKTTSRKK